MAPRVNVARIGRNNVSISDIKFVWNEAGFRQMQRQASIVAYMRAKAEEIANEMRQLTNGEYRTSEDYRNNRYSDSYPIGTSRQGRGLHESIESRGPVAIGSRDFPYSFNVGPYRYRGGGSVGGLENINYQRFGTGKQNGRDFIRDAVRNAIGGEVFES